MLNVEEKLAKSLTAETTEIIPYLPYLLQDLWELGSSPKDIIDIILKNIKRSERMMVLDLACGKGAVSVHIANALGCRVKGIDIIPEFIDFANKKALDFGVVNLCEFKVGDINEELKTEIDYDIVIFGAAGDVLGNAEETLLKLKSTVKNSGYIIIDDVYGKDGNDERYLTKEKWNTLFNKVGVEFLDDKLIDENELKTINDEQQSLIIKRAIELKQKYPIMAKLFDDYIKSQQDECDELENEILPVTILIQST